MAVQTVACPGCKATLKAPEEMAGKKAKCKKCGVSFRIPGGAEPTGDSVGDSQFLSAMDVPIPAAAAAAANPFDFGGEPEPPAKPAEKEKEKPVAKKPVPVPKVDPLPPPAAKPVSKAVPKPPVRKPKVEKEVDEEEEEEIIPAAAAVEDDDAEDEPAPAASADPFAFSPSEPAPAKPKSKGKEKDKEPEPAEKPAKAKKKKPEPEPEPEEKPAKKKKAEPAGGGGGAFAFGDDPAPGGLTDEPDEEEDEDAEPVVEKAAEKKGGKRGYAKKAGAKSGGGGGLKLIIAAAVFGVIVAGGVAAAIIYTNKDKAPEQANNNEKKNPEPPPVTPPVEPPGKGDPPKVDPKEKDKGTTPPKKDPGGKKTPPGSGPMLGLPAGRTINFLPPNPKPEQVQGPDNRLLVVPTLPADAAADAFIAARRVFPPQKRDIDIGVVWETAKGLQGAGQKLFLGIYSPQNGKQANQIAFDGDGTADPVCDLSADANLFAQANTVASVVHVWDTRTGMKVVDAFNPYTAAKSKDLKLAAVYITDPPLVFVTVSTTGAVHAFNVKTKDQMAGEFAPAKAPSKPLVAGKHIAPGPNHLSVVVYCAGSFYQVGIGPTVDGKEIVRLDGDVGRSFGIAGSAGGKMVFAFETDDKKDKAVMEIRGDGKHVFYRWPEKDAGEPTGVAWVDDGLVMVASDRGSCVWFETEGSDFRPIGIARTPNDKGRHVASDGHWTLLPDPMNPKQCVLVEYSKPQSGLIGALDSAKQPPSAILTDKGLLK